MFKQQLFGFLASFQQLLAFQAATFRILDGNFVRFYEHNRGGPMHACKQRIKLFTFKILVFCLFIKSAIYTSKFFLAYFAPNECVRVNEKQFSWAKFSLAKFIWQCKRFTYIQSKAFDKCHLVLKCITAGLICTRTLPPIPYFAV